MRNSSLDKNRESGSQILRRLARVSGYGVRIAWFVDAMVRKLDQNSHKEGWEGCTLQYLSMRLTQEREELRRAIERRDLPGEVTAECADIALFSMMIADVYRHMHRTATLAREAGL